MNSRTKELVESGLHLIPSHMHEGVRNYYYLGYKPGSFLAAVLSNDFMGAVGRADMDNLVALPQWGKFLYNHTPCGSYGSPENVKLWLESFNVEVGA